MRRAVARTEVVERVRYIRNLLRQRKPTNEAEQTLFAQYERKTKDFLSNVRRSSERPMLNVVRAMGEVCSLTIDGSHRLFGYDLDDVRVLDERFNRQRTHVIESYIFDRDLRIDLPLELAPAAEFERTSTLDNLVRRWQSDIPIRFLSGSEWKRPGTFYVRVGTADSLGSSIPPGSVALVERISDGEAQRPNPRHTYLLQFANGYRCSRCVLSAGKLQLLTSDRSYFGTEQFSYPSAARIAGRVRCFAVALPLPDYSEATSLSHYSGTADLRLPWEQSNRDRLFANEHRRFVRSQEEMHHVRELLQRELDSKLSDRTRRRYRHETASEPHVDALIQMSIEHYSAYSATLRAGNYPLRDRSRHSLESMLQARRIEDLIAATVRPRTPTPLSVWSARLEELVEWPALLSAEFPQLKRWSERVVRIAGDSFLPKLDPPLRDGAFLLTEEVPLNTDLTTDSKKSGWSRPLYTLSKHSEIFVGHLETEGDRHTLVRGGAAKDQYVPLGSGELGRLRRIRGALVPA